MKHGNQAFYHKLHCPYFPRLFFDDFFCEEIFSEEDWENSSGNRNPSDSSGDRGAPVGQ